MTRRIQVSSITKTNKQSPHECISHLGGVHWKLPLMYAIEGAENGDFSFYIIREGMIVDLIVAMSESVCKYLKAIDDEVMPSSLLMLKECT